MKFGSRTMRWLAWLAIFLMGSVWGSTCQFRTPGLALDIEDDDELYIDFPGGYIDFGPGNLFVDVPPFQLEIDD
ncbi:MAG: hypothetical protein ACYTF1_00420 [Planctomycetota bacterium]